MPLISAEEFATRAIKLFREHEEWLGLTTADFPEEDPERRQLECQSKFNQLACEYHGHSLIPDHCRKPEHDYCLFCGKRRDKMAADDVVVKDCRGVTH